MSKKRGVQSWQILRGWRGVFFNGELITLMNISLLCPFQSDYMIYADLFLFKSNISLRELKGFGTKKTGDVNCFINWLCIPIVIKVSPLVENLISNCVSTDVKYSSQNTIGLQETGNRISLSLVRFSWTEKFLVSEPEVKAFIPCVLVLIL